MTDNELRERIARVYGWVWVESGAYQSKGFWWDQTSPEPISGHAHEHPPALDGNTAMALLEKCVAEREWLQPIVISIFPSSAVISVSNVISFQALTTRNIIQACVLVLEATARAEGLTAS